MAKPKKGERVLIPARVTGVYGTAHTGVGDFDTDLPEQIDIDCELITFHLPIHEVKTKARMTSVTLHFGVVNVEVQVNPPVDIYPGNSVTIFMPVSLDSMAPSGKSVPSWSVDA